MPSEGVLVGVRAVHLAACLSLFGALLFRAALAPAALRSAPRNAADRLDRHLARLGAVSWLLTLAAVPPWLVLQATAMSGAQDWGEIASASAVVLRQTLFGHVLLMRIAVLLGVGLCLWPRAVARRWRVWTGVGLSGMALVLHAATGHAAAMAGPERSILLASLVVHFVAAGAWLGGLAPLAVTLATLPPSNAGVAARQFSPLGVASVAALALTAFGNGWVLIGGLPGLLGTPYGHLALAKLALFAAMLGLATANRFRFTPALAGPPATAHEAACRLRRSATLEVCLGLAVVAVAAVLASTPPGAHGARPTPAPVHAH